jgi:hypothetical protein
MKIKDIANMDLGKMLAKIRPIFISASRLDKVTQQAIEKALREHENWSTSAEGGEYYKYLGLDVGAAGTEGRSIFEDIDYGYIETKQKDSEGKVQESKDWTGVGLNIGYNPDIKHTVEDLRLQQEASVHQWSRMPPARAIIENYKRYCIGRGIKFNISVPVVEEYVARFWKQNKMEIRLKNGFRDWLLMGEIFWTYTLREKADFDKDFETPVIVRSIPSVQITDIEYDQDDYETVLTYKRDTNNTALKHETYYYKDISYPFEEDTIELGLPGNLNKSTTSLDVNLRDERVQIFKYGLTFDIRGRCFMETVLRWNRVLVDFVYDRGRLNHLRTKIFLIETNTGKRGSQLGTSYQRLPKGGLKLVETADKKYRMVAPNTGATDAESDYKMIVFTIASGVSMPYHILTQDASNSNYASIREAGTPFVQAVIDLQDDYGENVREQLMFVIAHGVRTGVLPEKVKVEDYPASTIGEMKRYIADKIEGGVPVKEIIESTRLLFTEEKKVREIRTIDVPIELIFPDIVHTESDKQANTLKVWRELGLISRQTSMRKIGVDPDIEFGRISQEDDDSFAKDLDKSNQMDQDRTRPDIEPSKKTKDKE